LRPVRRKEDGTDIVAAEEGGHPRIRRQGRSNNLLPPNAGRAEEIIEKRRDPFEEERLQPFALPGQRCFQAADNIGTDNALRICHLPFGQSLSLRIEEAAGEGGGAKIKGKRSSHNPPLILFICG